VVGPKESTPRRVDPADTAKVGLRVPKAPEACPPPPLSIGAEGSEGPNGAGAAGEGEGPNGP